MPNNREWATLTWLVLALVVIMSIQSVRTQIFDLFKILFGTKIFAALVAMGIYVGSLIALGGHMGLWTSSLVTDTVIWVAGTACVLFFNANAARDTKFFVRAAVGTLEISALSSLFFNLFVLNYWIELAVIIPTITLFSLVSTVAKNRPEYAPARTVADIILVLAGIFLMIYVVANLAANWAAIDPTQEVLRLFLPVWMTTGFLPFIFFFALLMAYESAFVRIRFVIREPDEQRKAKIRLAKTCHLRLNKIASFRPDPSVNIKRPTAGGAP